jgi:hypothetical protein
MFGVTWEHTSLSIFLEEFVKAWRSLQDVPIVEELILCWMRLVRRRLGLM